MYKFKFDTLTHLLIEFESDIAQAYSFKLDDDRSDRTTKYKFTILSLARARTRSNYSFGFLSVFSGHRAQRRVGSMSDREIGAQERKGAGVARVGEPRQRARQQGDKDRKQQYG